MRFYPDVIRVETDKLYRLRLINRSPHPHYFSSENFARGIFTRKIESLSANRERRAEVKGRIREIEVFPGGAVDWWFVPVQKGISNDLRCSVNGHAKTGMVGTIISE